jgi:DNA topoisomerase III
MRLFICEKPSQAADIAKHVGARQAANGFRVGPGVTVTWCIGHLLEQSPPEHYKPELATWSLDHLPVLPKQWNMDVKTATKSQFAVVSKLLKQASEVVVATDADREGEVIAREVMQLCGYRGPVKRLWLSSLDDVSVKKALARLLPGEKTLPLYFSGLGRARADWLAGMNLTMALTKAFGAGGRDGVVHCGRVQTPVLGLVVRRERAIRQFIPKPYFVLRTVWEMSGSHVPMTWQTAADRLDKDGHCVDEDYIQSVATKIAGKVGRLVAVECDEKTEPPPLLYCLSALQKEASARFGMGAQQLLGIAQSLYEKHKATTYPRTDCEYVPQSMHAEAAAVCASITAADPAMSKLVAAANLAVPSRAFNDAKITAHHAIIPTANTTVRLADMSANERLIYDLIRRRYLAQFLGVFRYEETRIVGQCQSESFAATGRVPLVAGWKRAYADLVSANTGTTAASKSSDEEDGSPRDLVLPDVQVGQQMINRLAKVAKTQTKAPKRYTVATLLGAMESIDKEIEDPRLKRVMQNKEKAGIGTDATRGATLEGLFNRGYFQRSGKHIAPTSKGEQLIEIVERAVPHMADPVLTALWEDQLARVEDGSVTLATFEAQLCTWLSAQIEKIKLCRTQRHH